MEHFIPRIALIALCFFTLTAVCALSTVSGSDGAGVTQRLNELESKIERLENEVSDLQEVEQAAFFSLFLFGVVLAMWAQRQGENGCLWFIIGIIPGINVIAALIALANGPKSAKAARNAERKEWHEGDEDAETQ